MLVTIFWVLFGLLGALAWFSASRKEFLVEKQQKKLAHILSRHNGGLYKRIDQNRELLELLQTKAPELLSKNPWVLTWLESTDNFLMDIEALDVVKDAQFSPKSYGRAFPRPRNATMGSVDVCEVCAQFSK